MCRKKIRTAVLYYQPVLAGHYLNKYLHMIGIIEDHWYKKALNRWNKLTLKVRRSRGSSHSLEHNDIDIIGGLLVTKELHHVKYVFHPGTVAIITSGWRLVFNWNWFSFWLLRLTLLFLQYPLDERNNRVLLVASRQHHHDYVIRNQNVKGRRRSARSPCTCVSGSLPSASWLNMRWNTKVSPRCRSIHYAILLINLVVHLHLVSLSECSCQLAYSESCSCIFRFSSSW